MFEVFEIDRIVYSERIEFMPRRIVARLGRRRVKCKQMADADWYPAPEFSQFSSDAARQLCTGM